jgi:hypothetical protein
MAQVYPIRNIYWHICNSSRVLKLDACTLEEFSYLPVPAEVGDHFNKYRIGEVPEDGRLFMVVAADEEELQIWVPGDVKWSDRGWLLERRICMDKVPGLPTNRMNRMLCTGLATLTTHAPGRCSSRRGDMDATRSTCRLASWSVGDGRWQGARRSHLGLLLGLSACFPCFRRLITFR